MSKPQKTNNNYEVNSYWYRDVTTNKNYFNILCDYKIEHLIAIIQQPMLDGNNEQLRNISRRFYSSDGIVRNAIDMMKALPTLDYIVTSYVNDKDQ